PLPRPGVTSGARARASARSPPPAPPVTWWRACARSTRTPGPRSASSRPPHTDPVSLKFAILTSLTEREGSGIELARRFDKSIGYFWPATHQQIYRELDRLGTLASSANCRSRARRPLGAIPGGSGSRRRGG